MVVLIKSQVDFVFVLFIEKDIVITSFDPFINCQKRNIFSCYQLTSRSNLSSTLKQYKNREQKVNKVIK